MNPDQYARNESARNEAYRKAFRSPEFTAWVNSLTPEQRMHAEKMGLLSPRLEGEGARFGADDLPPSHTPSDDGGFADFEEKKAGVPESIERLDEIRRQLLESFLKRRGKPGLQWACLYYLCGHGTCEQHARILGMSKQAFHYHVRSMQKMLGLPPLGNQKSAQAREKYRQMNRRRTK